MPTGNVLNESWKLCSERPNCFNLLLHVIRRAASRAACTAGNNNATRIPMMAITTNNSTRVNPTFFLRTSMDELLPEKSPTKWDEVNEHETKLRRLRKGITREKQIVE